MEQHLGGSSRPQGTVRLQATRNLGDLRPPTRIGLGWHVRNWLRYRYREVPALTATRFVGRLAGLVFVESQLKGWVYRADWSKLAPWEIIRLRQLLADNHPVWDLPRFFGGQAIDYGVLSTRKVTTAGVGYVVDAFQNLVEPENMKYHGYGTGTNAEANSDTALQTELTTQYAVDNTRPTGSQGEGATANVYRTTATLSPDASVAITEHGIFSQAATGGGTLWDRSVFAAVNLTGGADSLQTQYDATFPAEA